LISVFGIKLINQSVLSIDIENRGHSRAKSFTMSGQDSESSSPPAQSPPMETEKHQRSVTGLRWFLICLAIYSCNLLYGLDNTIVADIQAPIIASLGNINKLGWLGIGFPLGAIAIILPV
jgi:hypothetical protein